MGTKHKRPATPRITEYAYAEEGLTCRLHFEKRGWALTVNNNTPDNRYSKPEACLEEMVENEVMITWGIDSATLLRIPLELSKWRVTSS